uniref:Uncharacterized protein n=2 Tax=Anguilla anguilla TaxID=7936 RepID=A0A0E9QH75_ANGAN
MQSWVWRTGLLCTALIHCIDFDIHVNIKDMHVNVLYLFHQFVRFMVSLMLLGNL